MFDVVVIGAGIAGLTCARQLQQAGYQVAVIEKSRGVGGRVATRRVQSTCVDHGARYLERPQDQGTEFEKFFTTFLEQQILQPWTTQIYELDQQQSDAVAKAPAEAAIYPRYVPRTGMTAIAKFLAQTLDLHLNQRVQRLQPIAEGWQLQISSNSAADLTMTARAIVIAIPAPQALVLCEPLAAAGLAAEFLMALRAVEFTPCFSAIAGYPAARQSDIGDLPWSAIAYHHDPVLSWLSLESNKRLPTEQPIVVFQSTAAFASQFLEQEHLEAIGQEMLMQAGRSLLPWLAQPEWLQVHRWRYAFVHTAHPAPYLHSPETPSLICCGDWCGGQAIADAFHSGWAAAVAVADYLRYSEAPEPIS